MKVAMPLTKFIGNQKELKVENSRLFDIFKKIDTQYPHFLSKICDTNGRVYPYLNVFVNDDLVNNLNCISVNDGDEICIIPSIRL